MVQNQIHILGCFWVFFMIFIFFLHAFISMIYGFVFAFFPYYLTP